MGGKDKTLIYKKKPVFGLDIGSNTIKIMQIDSSSKNKKLICYGVGKFDSKDIKDGVIDDFESLAKSINEIFNKNLIGKITTNRVALTIPTNKTFTKVMTIPKIKNSEIKNAVELEVDGFIPIPLADLYLDYEVVVSGKENLDILVAAAPKKVIDSYMILARMLGLEPAAFDTSITANARLFNKQDDQSEVPAVLIDLGSDSADITIHDKMTVVTSTISSGGDVFTTQIAKRLGVSAEEAHIIKTKYGLGKSKKQKDIQESIDADLQKLVKEVKKMMRYYEERSESQSKIGQIITMGGGANMPGLTEYLINNLRVPVRTCNPWQKIKFGKLQPPPQIEKSMYVTVAGLSLIQEEDLFS